MKESFAKFIASLSFIEAVQAFGILVVSLLAFLVTIALVLDHLNVKSISLKGLTFYQDGDVKKSRITRRTKTVKRKAKK